MIPQIDQHFPEFASRLADCYPEEIEPGLTADQLGELEKSLGIPLPASYKTLLSLCGSLWLFGGAVQFGSQHPFFHDFPPIESMNPQQLAVINERGGSWPPPSQGMLCFAEYFWQADGDQMLFKVDDGLQDGEYPVYYYSHESNPPTVTKMADSFREWLEGRCVQDFDEDD